MDYDNWAEAYGDIFPLDESKLSFLREHLGEGRIADIGCATGAYVRALAMEGNHVEGYDVAPALIEMAKRRTKDLNHATFHIMDMLDFDGRNAYDGIYTIGNSLVHLQEPAKIQAALVHFYKVLKKGGRLIVQIVNYDRILSQDIKELPAIHGEHYSLERRYSYVGGFVNFKTILKKNSQHFTNEVLLYPLTSGELDALAREAGFESPAYHGGFTERSFDKDKSFALVGVFEK